MTKKNILRTDRVLKKKNIKKMIKMIKNDQFLVLIEGRLFHFPILSIFPQIANELDMVGNEKSRLEHRGVDNTKIIVRSS